MSVRVTLNCHVKPERFDQLTPFLEENLPNVRGFKGNLRVSVLYDKENGEMLLDEEWISEQHHQEYLRFIGENGVLDQLSHFLKTSPEIKYFAKVEI